MPAAHCTEVAPPTPAQAERDACLAQAAVAVVIPCYKVSAHILEVLQAMPAGVRHVLVVDDACPQGSGQLVQQQVRDARVQVLFHTENQGVGAAVMSGYARALELGAQVVVKVDGDGQMDPALIPRFVQPIVRGQADYTKGNRFYRPESLRSMPGVRLLGNLVLSFLTKLSSGYWPNMDPTNGYTAISAKVLRALPLQRIARRYFFETDMLFRLGTLRAVVRDVPMDAVYAQEVSNLKIRQVLPQFLLGNLSRALKRYAYSYWVRDFNLGSLYSAMALLLLGFGLPFGIYHWQHSIATDVPASSGTVMLAGLTVMVGVQCLIAFLHYDVSNVPTQPIADALE
ncbi:glycosyltransferase family 2 protein [Vandammella animalimorsus]|uniref:Glycosyl transferase family 2 n=1 Tax=Vandammella animalimorsus TaxID=2029117 RepID=A0A2A2AL55_9BURK|nr:glycosyltransferase family 2 protein [Vandammella animalimorsus]PAT38442.1 glycosyl transferase family 2 [Vandammella animalimorsus]